MISLVVSYNVRTVKEKQTQACPSQVAQSEFKAFGLGTEVLWHGVGKKNEQRISNSFLKKKEEFG